jgi:hypothetical protein
MEIRGEYWIEDGHVQFADGDVGDYNHEGYAIMAVVGQYQDEVVDFAEKLGIEDNKRRNYDEPNNLHTQELIVKIYEKLTERTKRPMDDSQARSYIMRSIGCNKDAYDILCGSGDGRMYAMEYYGWIAVRSNNVEFYGWDQQKKKQISNGIRDIIYEEDYSASENLDPNEVELWLEDLKNNKTWSTTLAELEEPEIKHSFKTSYPNFYPVNAKYNPNSKLGQLMARAKDKSDREENKYVKPAKSVIKPWNVAAQKSGVGSELWRGTSESNLEFKNWLGL